MLSALGSLLGSGGGLQELFVRARLPWLELEAGEGLAINLDGEPLEARRARFEVRPAALRLHLPADSPLLGG